MALERSLTTALAVGISVWLCDQPGRAVLFIDTVIVGNPGNPGESQIDGTFGGVSYVYRMATYEVTAGQYTAFLNAVAATDTYALYDTRMWTHAEGCKIERSGSAGGFAYTVAADRANRPVNFVSFGDALRFANWMHNGQPAGAQSLLTTEHGSYALNGLTADHELEDIVREPDATWVVPSEDEWYKAAYHANDGITGNYFNYPMGCDFGVSNDVTDPAPDPGCHATYYHHPSDFTIGAPYHRTEAGAHENSPSPYGTFDQGGNVWEFNEAIPLFGGRGLRGGAYSAGSDSLAAWTRPIEFHSSDQFSDLGFRLSNLDLPQFEPGDVNDDGAVNIDDLVAVITQWGFCQPKSLCAADISPFPDGDGEVDIDDLVAVIVNWGS